MKIRPWLQFFRLPNLPTAPGDALAGAAFLLQDGAGGFAQAVAAGPQLARHFEGKGRGQRRAEPENASMREGTSGSKSTFSIIMV